jgi:hypothetical protein
VLGPLLENDLDEFRQDWNTHRITKTKGASGPFGRPVDMYALCEPMYGAKNYAVPAPAENVAHLRQEAKVDVPVPENIMSTMRPLIAKVAGGAVTAANAAAFLKQLLVIWDSF